MKINVEIKTIYKLSSSPLRATAVVILDDCFMIHNVKVVDTGNGPFVSMPSFKGRDGQWRSICHPMTNEFRQEIQKKVLEAYQKG